MKTYNIFSIDEFKTNIENNSRLLGIDPGKRNIGLAICDENKISSLSKDLSSIMKFIEKLNELNTCLLYTSDAADE